MRLFALAAVILLVADPAAPQPPPTFRAPTPPAQGKALAQDGRGRVVTDLTRDDFIILEDGKEQTIDLFSIEAGRVGSKSMPDVSAQTSPARLRPEALATAHEYTNRMAARPGGVTVIVLDRL